MLDLFQRLLKRTVFRELPGDNVLGQRGENVAAKHLRNLGYRIITRNFRCPMGEIDIIARDGKTLVFVEVKTRQSDEVPPEQQVHLDKQQRLIRAARFYLSRYGTPQPPARFDVVSILWPPGRDPVVNHIPHAFEAS